MELHVKELSAKEIGVELSSESAALMVKKHHADIHYYWYTFIIIMAKTVFKIVINQ